MSDIPDPKFPEGPSDEEIEARLRRVREELAGMSNVPDLAPNVPESKPLPKAPDLSDIEARLAELDSKVKTTSDRRHETKKEEKRNQESSASASRSLGLGLSIAYTIIGAPLLCIGIGALVDTHLRAPIGKATGATVGMILGIAGALLLISRQERLDK